jgi:hypothetical protein
MPRLSVHCVITQHDGRTQQSRRDTWIDAQDFRELALAATAQLRLSPDRCEYTLFAPDVGKAFVGVLLEVVHDGLSALVGPMGGPAVPDALAGEERCTFDELMSLTGFDADAGARGLHPVTVVYAGCFGLGVVMPERHPKESGAEYRVRRATVERVRLERGRHEGFHVLRYEAPSAAWRAEDLEALLERSYALLPPCEPRWRESGTIMHEPSPASEASAGMSRCALEVQRGDFVAHLRLPAFPVSALAGWLANRRCEISLRHPIGRERWSALTRRGGVGERLGAETRYSAA